MLNLISNYRRKINLPYSVSDLPVLLASGFTLLLVSLIVISSVSTLNTKPYSAGGQVLGTQSQSSVTSDWNVSLDFPETTIYVPEMDIYVMVGALKEGLKFTSYKIEYGVGPSPSDWSTKGIILAADNNNPKVGSHVRATWNTSLLTANRIYKLRFVAQTNDGRSVEVSRILGVDKTVLFGWPKEITVWNDHGTPIVGDINNDGNKEILVLESKYQESTGRSQERVYAFKKDGTEISGWPVILPEMTSADISTFSGGAKSSLVLTNIVGDEGKEIVVRYGEKILILDKTGEILPGWPKTIPFLKSSVSVGDLGGNGTKEIVAVSASYGEDNNFVKVYALDVEGNTISEFPKTLLKNGKSMKKPFQNMVYDITLVDIEGDKKMEMVINPKVLNHDSIYVLDSKGSILSGWPKVIKGVEIYRTLAGDITGDGLAEIIAYYSDPTVEVKPNSYKKGTTYITVFDKRGKEIEGYPQEAVVSVPQMGPSLADITGDGMLDIVVPNYKYFKNVLPYDCSPLVYKKDGLVPNLRCSHGHAYLQAISDVNSDGNPDIVATSSVTDLIHVLSKISDSDGSIGWKSIWQRKAGDFRGQPLVADLDNNGKWEIITTIQYYTSNLILVWEPEIGDSTSGTSWEQYRKDEARSSTYIPGKVSKKKDTESPSTPQLLKAKVVSPKKVRLSWQASNDNIGVKGYYIFRDAANIADTTDTNFVDTTLKPGKKYKYQVTAFDAAGNVSKLSEEVRVEVPQDKQIETKVQKSEQNLTVVFVAILGLVTLSGGFGWWKKQSIKTLVQKMKNSKVAVKIKNYK